MTTLVAVTPPPPPPSTGLKCEDGTQWLYDITTHQGKAPKHHTEWVGRLPPVMHEETQTSFLVHSSTPGCCKSCVFSTEGRFLQQSNFWNVLILFLLLYQYLNLSWGG